MKLHLSAQIGPVTITLMETVFFTATVFDSTETEHEARLLGERPNITGVSRDDTIKQIADRLVTIHLKAVFTAELIRAQSWLVEPMCAALLEREQMIWREIRHAEHPSAAPLLPDSHASMAQAARRCRSLYDALTGFGEPSGLLAKAEAGQAQPTPAQRPGRPRVWGNCPRGGEIVDYTIGLCSCGECPIPGKGQRDAGSGDRP